MPVTDIFCKPRFYHFTMLHLQWHILITNLHISGPPKKIHKSTNNSSQIVNFQQKKQWQNSYISKSLLMMFRKWRSWIPHSIGKFRWFGSTICSTLRMTCKCPVLVNQLMTVLMTSPNLLNLWKTKNKKIKTVELKISFNI